MPPRPMIANHGFTIEVIPRPIKPVAFAAVRRAGWAPIEAGRARRPMNDDRVGIYRLPDLQEEYPDADHRPYPVTQAARYVAP